MIQETVGRYMLRTARQFIIKHKDIFRAAIVAYAKVLPDPIDEDGNGLPVKTGSVTKVVAWENSPVVMEIFRKFLAYCAFREEMMSAGAKITVDELEHDPAYRDAFLFLVEEFVEATLDGRLKPRRQNNPPESIWKEPKPYGNFIGRRFTQLIRE